VVRGAPLRRGSAAAAGSLRAAVCERHNLDQPMTETAVIDRDEELAAIGAFLDAVPQGPAALVLSGEAGIGKTMLLRVGVARARERFACVLTCRGIEGEASLSFAGLSDLLGAVLDDVLPLLVAPRRRALEIALLLVQPGEGAADAHAVAD
jgi:hypothetical protein